MTTDVDVREDSWKLYKKFVQGKKLSTSCAGTTAKLITGPRK
jgi:hypothetical protein